MTNRILRTGLAIAGLALLAGAAALAMAGCPVGAIARLAFIGLVLVAAALVERWRYKRFEPVPPGPGWIDNQERFVDPETGRLVAVYYRPATGERRYVAL